MIWVDIVAVFIISSLFWMNPVIEYGYMKKFRIVQKYCSHKGTYYYDIESLWYFFWIKADVGPLRRSFASCKEAEDALEKWYLEETTNHIILEREFIL
jgi:hypothetical protein